MNRNEAMAILGNGHSIWSVEAAKGVCENIGVPWSEALVKKHYSYQSEYSPKYDLAMDTEGEETVSCYALTDYVMRQLDVEPLHFFHGRGSQAQHNAKVIQQALDQRG
jgi:hypothetical protein